MSETHTATSSASGRQAAGRDQGARLRRSSLVVAVMLIIQFILGMIYNLYGTAPTSAKPVGLFSSPDLALHVILGFLLLLAAIGQLVQAIGARHQLSIWLSAIGLLSIIGAGFAGLGFAGSGADGASLGMSLAFATALVCYVVLVFALPSSAAVSARGASNTPTTLCSRPLSTGLGPRGIVGT
jgi:hypothetical protein